MYRITSPEAIDLLRRSLELITDHPELHMQGVWLDRSDDASDVDDQPNELDIVFNPERPTACGTVGCLAGNAVLLSGRYPLSFTDANAVETHVFVHGRWRVFDEYARPLAIGLLDLDVDSAEVLFGAERSLGELWHVAELLTNGRIVPPSGIVTDVDRQIEDYFDDDYLSEDQ